MPKPYWPDSRQDVVAELQTPTVQEIAVLAGLAMQADHPNFKLEHPNEFGDRYIAEDDVLLPGDPENDSRIEVAIGLRQLDDKYPVFTVSLQTTGPISSLVDIDMGLIQKVDKYRFEPTSSWSRSKGYTCTEAKQFYWVKRDGRMALAPIQLPESSRQGKRNLNKLEEWWGVNNFTREKYNRLLYVLGEFSIGRARLGKS